MHYLSLLQMPENGKMASIGEAMIEKDYAFPVDESVSIEFGRAFDSEMASIVLHLFADKRLQRTNLLRTVPIVSIYQFLTPSYIAKLIFVTISVSEIRFEMLETGIYPSMQNIKKMKKKGFDFHLYEQSIITQ